MVDFSVIYIYKGMKEGKEKPRREYQGCKSGAPTGMRVSRQSCIDGDEVRRYDSSHKYKASRSSIPASWGVGLHMSRTDGESRCGRSLAVVGSTPSALSRILLQGAAGRISVLKYKEIKVSVTSARIPYT